MSATRLGKAGMARQGRRGVAWRSMARQGKAGVARFGEARPGKARQVWRGLARLGQPKERKKIFRKETTCTSTTV